MSVHYATYQRKCDRCGAIHPVKCDSPRRAIAAAKRDGWQRRAIGQGNYSWDKSDVCPACLDVMESEGV